MFMISPYRQPSYDNAQRQCAGNGGARVFRDRFLRSIQRVLHHLLQLLELSGEPRLFLRLGGRLRICKVPAPDRPDILTQLLKFRAH
jgi:hypothetical protein